VRKPIQVVVYIAKPNGNEWQYLLLRGEHFWQGVSGGVENSETTLETAYREIRLETGFTPHRLVDLAYIWTFPERAVARVDATRGPELFGRPSRFPTNAGTRADGNV
jgi:8-oxo-dGTP pyrophosphatase MutT (NUDIX family)